MDKVVLQTAVPGLPAPRRGKVRDVYDLGELLLLVATDRLSAYDHVLSPGIPGKGRILTQLSNFWFGKVGEIVPHHLVATEVADFPAHLHRHREVLEGRSVLVRKTRVVPFECVARGYLAGSAFREYQDDGTACGLPLEPGLTLASRLAEPIFTPATKAEAGHDENIDFARLAAGVGERVAARLRDLTLAIYRLGAAHAESCALLLADTKLEFGFGPDDDLLLIDEVLTPDSSRYWDRAGWVPGVEPASFDKQFVRNWLDASGWDRESPPPPLPEEVVEGTRLRYVEAFRRLTGRPPRL